MTNSIDNTAIIAAINTLKKGGIIAYPTEGVYGLGCDPFNASAVEKIYERKQRAHDKPFLWVASEIEPFLDFIDIHRVPDYHTIFDHWPSANTWVFPLKPQYQHTLPFQKDTIAIRVSAHPIIQALGEKWQKPLVSTSANVSNNPAALTTQTVIDYFGEKTIDTIIEGKLGDLSGPTPLFDAISKQQLR